MGEFTDDQGKQFQRYVTAGEVGISDVPADDYVVWSGGQAKACNDVSHGDLDVTGVSLDLVGGGTVVAKSAFTLLREAALSKSRSEYSSICGVSVGTMESLAAEFVGHGKKAVAITYRGPIKHTNGFYNQLAIQHLNTLVGNYDWKGGCTAGAGGWSHKSGVVESRQRSPGDPGQRVGYGWTGPRPSTTLSEAGRPLHGIPGQATLVPVRDTRQLPGGHPQSPGRLPLRAQGADDLLERLALLGPQPCARSGRRPWPTRASCRLLVIDQSGDGRGGRLGRLRATGQLSTWRSSRCRGFPGE